VRLALAAAARGQTRRSRVVPPLLPSALSRVGYLMAARRAVRELGSGDFSPRMKVKEAIHIREEVTPY